jgi:ATP-binding cassette subfamily A (ABC1) protein 3
MPNLATNVLYKLALNSSGNARGSPVVRQAYYSTFPKVYALYASRERLSSIQAMQSSNGLTNLIALCLGHLMSDTISSVFPFDKYYYHIHYRRPSIL